MCSVIVPCLVSNYMKYKFVFISSMYCSCIFRQNPSQDQNPSRDPTNKNDWQLCGYILVHLNLKRFDGSPVCVRSSNCVRCRIFHSGMTRIQHTRQHITSASEPTYIEFGGFIESRWGDHGVQHNCDCHCYKFWTHRGTILSCMGCIETTTTIRYQHVLDAP